MAVDQEVTALKAELKAVTKNLRFACNLLFSVWLYREHTPTEAAAQLIQEFLADQDQRL